MGFDREERICIVGAGAAGLSAAVYLRDAGYRNVVVLEREAEVGGKCRSFRRDGKAWELGAVLGTSDYEVTLDLMRRVGLEPWRRKEARRETDRSFECRGIIPLEHVYPDWLRPREAAGAAFDVLRYHALSPRWSAAFAAGHEAVPDELAEPIAAWARRWRMEHLTKAWSIPFTAYGYGYYDDIPAAYGLKFLDTGVTRSLMFKRKFFYWREGVQELWERTAASLDVRKGVELKSARRGEKVELSWLESDGSGGREAFDRLVIACPLDDALGFLDADKEELSLAAPILTNDYRVRLLEVEGLRVPAGFVPSRFDRSGIGRPLIWDERVPGSGLITWYVLAEPGTSDAEVDRRIAEDVELLGGTIRGCKASVNWKYFPHVPTAVYREGWYRRFEARQGRRRTYLAGEIASFSTVERSARYSRELVRRFFA